MSNVMPIRIQRSRKHKQVSPNGLPIVYVGRPSKFGNPFIMPFGNPFARLRVIEKYRDYLNEHPELITIIKAELKGKNLSCWCSLSERCHSDVLLKIANE